MTPNAIAVHYGGTISFHHPRQGLLSRTSAIPAEVWQSISPGERARVLHALRGYRVTHSLGGMWIGDKVGSGGSGLTTKQAKLLIHASAARRRAAKKSPHDRDSDLAARADVPGSPQPGSAPGRATIQGCAHA